MPIIGRLFPADDPRRYRRASVWLIRDVIRFAPFRLLTIVGLDGASLAIAASIFASALLYARRAQLEQPFELFGRSLDTGSPRSLLLLAAFVVVAGLGATGFALVSGLLAKRLVRQWQVHTLARYLRLARGRDFEMRFERAKRVRQRPLALGEVSRAVKCAAFAIDAVLTAMLPLLLAAGAAVGLVWVNAPLSALLLLVLPLFLVPLALCYRRIARHHLVYYQSARAFSPRLKQWLDVLQLTDLPMRDPGEMLEDPVFVRMLDALYGRRVMPVLVRALNGAFVIVIIAIVLADALRIATWGGVDWARVVAYLVLLRFLSAGVLRSTLALTTVNRMFDSYEAMSLLLTDPGPAAPEPTAARIDLGEAGKRTLLLASFVGEPQWGQRVRGMLDDAERDRLLVHHRLGPLEHMSPVEHLAGAGASDADCEPLREHLEALGVAGGMQACGVELTTPLEPAHLAAMSPELAFALTTAYLDRHAPVTLVQSIQDLSRLEPGFRARWLEGVARHRLVLADCSTRRFLAPSAPDLRAAVGSVLVVDASNGVESGDVAWLERERERIDDMLTTTAAASTEPDVFDDDEDLDDI